MSEYWGIEDSEFYDEDGFAKGLPANHSGRLLKQALDLMTGEQPKVKIRKDYTEEFSSIMPGVRVTTRDPRLTKEVIFDFNLMIADQRYAFTLMVLRYEIESPERFDEHRFYLYRQAAHLIQHKIIEMCDHDWQPLHSWVKCSKCGFQQDTPSGNIDRSGMFK